ncbi:MAG TPA: YebC/PmpR family DNA-binding transcriptional regulator [bacterium]|nr:YebC/PmpR family DNA-binding transcriptional regulator [bacterium]
MSGHSKWATTKRKKATIDAKRAKLFTKIAKLITIAARDGKSGDPSMNPGLRLAVDNARAISMPKDNIDRAIKHGIGESGTGAKLEEIQYEAYGPGGAAILIECLTDNRNRAIAEIKATLNKNNGSMATTGSVSYLFKKVGQVILDEEKNRVKGEELELIILESGADDFSKEDNFYVLVCEFTKLISVRKKLEESQIVVDAAEVSYMPNSDLELDESKKESVVKLLEALDDLEDVNNVYTNASL